MPQVHCACQQGAALSAHPNDSITIMTSDTAFPSLQRRQWLRWALSASATAAAAPWLGNSAHAAPLPSIPAVPGKPITIIVGGPAGGATDGVARVIAQAMSASLQREVIVDNKPGAGGTIGSKIVSHSKNDGHTLLLGQIAPNVLSPLMQNPKPYDPITGFTPVGQIGNTASVLVVPAGGPQTLQAAISLWKRKGSVSYASTGVGSGAHLLGHLLASALDIEGLHIPYRGSPFALQDLTGGRVDAFLVTAGALGSYLESGKLVALATASRERSHFYPHIPTLREAGLRDVTNEGWFGLFAAAQTPDAIAAALHQHLNHALQQPEVKTQLSTLIVDIAPSPSHTAYAHFISQEVQHWSQVLARMGSALQATT